MSVRKSPTTQFDKSLATYHDDVTSQIDLVRQLSSQEKEDDTRQDVTKKFVKYYFWIMIALMIVTPLYNLATFWLFRNETLLIPFKDAILTYSAVVGPTFGLVVAYYFKTSRD